MLNANKKVRAQFSALKTFFFRKILFEKANTAVFKEKTAKKETVKIGRGKQIRPFYVSPELYVIFKITFLYSALMCI